MAPIFRLLIVDDDDNVLDLYKFWIEQYFGTHILVLANCGEMAKRHLQESCFDLVILDSQMPDVNGVDLGNYIREGGDGRRKFKTSLSVPIILVTGGYSGRIPKGNSLLMSKPIKFDLLAEILVLLISGEEAGTVSARFRTQLSHDEDFTANITTENAKSAKPITKKAGRKSAKK